MTLEQLMISDMGKRISSFVSVNNGADSRLEIEPDKIKEKIRVGLRSRYIRPMLTVQQQDDLKLFRKAWNALDPLFEKQTESLKRNHSSRKGLNDDEVKRKLSIQLIAPSESDMGDLEELLNSFEPRRLFDILKDVVK